MSDPQPLPGFEPPKRSLTRLEELCEEFLKDIEAKGQMTPLRRLLGEVARTQSLVIGVGSPTAKTSAVLAVPQLLNAIAAMDLPQDSGQSKNLGQIMETLKAQS
ncbi:hypothetical protein [Actinomyces urogenitalis]|uniref:hypothetical protein n=1 Tax=Actinomyces urogenitalis TaxID=103621 RepID=UPI00242F85CD|nr:hypothetical protein [Actinomyces urogenitalis]MCI7456982.1 hypothetical protein [Actinomyces urogenitalis]